MMKAFTAVLAVLVLGMFTGMFFGARFALVAMGAGAIVVVGVALWNTPAATRVQILGGALGVLGVAAYFTLGREAEKKYVAASMADIHDQVANDAVAQYGIAKRQGDAMMTCVQAGMVAASFLQAKNEVQYNVWKATERDDCARAGVPR